MRRFFLFYSRFFLSFLEKMAHYVCKKFKLKLKLKYIYVYLYIYTINIKKEKEKLNTAYL